MIETWKASKETQAKLQEAADAVAAGDIVHVSRRTRNPLAEGGVIPGPPYDPGHDRTYYIPLHPQGTLYDAVKKHKLAQLHEQIAHIYRWWANEAPGVTPREDGHLANLWAEVDKLSEDELSGE